MCGWEGVVERCWRIGFFGWCEVGGVRGAWTREEQEGGVALPAEVWPQRQIFLVVN